MLRVFAAALIAAGSAAASAQVSDYVLDEMQGYELIAKKRIAGYIDGDGKYHDDFEGCEFDWRIVFTDDTGVTCSQFKYMYSYMPTAYVFSDGYQLRMVVKDRVFRVRRR